MGDRTAIQWAESTWNPVVGCSVISKGCQNCYAMRLAHDLERRFNSPDYRGLTKVVNGNPIWTGETRVIPGRLDQPLRWKKPRRIFVNSMSDLFHESLSESDIMSVFEVMEIAKQHQFLILTKRAERMREFGLRHETNLPNVWLGVSIEDQRRFDERIGYLHDTPAAVRFISFEPLLGPIHPHGRLRGIDWAIIGGESGPGAREMRLVWAAALLAECQAADVATFMKQLGAVPIDGDGAVYPLRDHKGGDPSEWPEWARVREYPR